MIELNPATKHWLTEILGRPFTTSKHAFANQDDVYTIKMSDAIYYLKIATTLTSEHDNLVKLKTILNVPAIIGFCTSDTADYLLISELPGKNLVEHIGELSTAHIVSTFAKSVRQFHEVDASRIFPQAGVADVLLHGDMALPNIILSNDGDIGYIDVGRLAFGSPDHDIADAIWSLQRNLGPNYSRQFLKEYGPVTLTSKIETALQYRYEETH